MKTKEELRKQIETEFSWWQDEHRHLPNVAYVKCHWYGDEEPEDCVQTIVIDDEYYKSGDEEWGVPYIPDDDVLYYCSNIESLLDLINDDNGSDFKVVDFIGFERLKEDK